MNIRAVRSHLSSLLSIAAIALVPALLLALYDGDFRAFFAFFGTAALVLTVAFGLKLRGRDKESTIGRKEAIIVVLLAWVLLCCGYALPFLFTGVIPDFPSALFEATSGLTTTGATVIADVEALGRSINFYRCFMHWLGGMGIVILFVAIFPQLGVGARFLFENESAGPASESTSSKIKKSALGLWWIYTFLTALCIVMLKLGGMGWFDAVCHGFSTLGTGGFSTKNTSIGYYNSPQIDWTIIFFMFVAALNFGLLLQLMRGTVRPFLRNRELQFFLVMNLVVALLVCVDQMGQHASFLTGLRMGLFQTLAVSSSTGFMTQDYNLYPNVIRYLFLLLMLMGGCAGSTAGGLKVVRVTSLFSMLRREVHLTSRPRDIVPLRLSGRVIQNETIVEILLYICVFLGLIFVCSGFLVMAGYGIESSLSAVIACLSSIGPGINEFGPTANFGHVPGGLKLLLCFCMIAGRLEILILMAPFSRSFWRR